MEISPSKWSNSTKVYNHRHCSDTLRVDLPALTQVKGAFNLQTSGQFDCSDFDKIHDSKAVIRGKYTCSGSKSDPGTADSTSTSTSSGSSPSKTAAAAHFQLNAPIIMGGSSFVAGLLQFFL